MTPLLLYFSYVLGLLPFNRMYMKSHHLMDYTLMLIFPVIYVICFIFTFIKGDFAVFLVSACPNVCSFINQIFIQLGFFLYITTHLISIFRRKHFFSVFEKKLKIIDDLIEQCQHLSNYKPKKENRNQNCGLYLLLGILGISLGCVIAFDALEMVKLYEIMFWIPLMTSSFPYLAASIVQMQFISYVAILLKRFSNLNKLFQKIYDDCIVMNIKNQSLKIYDIDNQFFQKSTNIEFKTKDPRNFRNNDVTNKREDFKEIPSTNPSPESILPKLFELHDKILSLCEITNNEYGSRTVPYMSCCFIMIILTIYVQAKVMVAVGVKNHFLNYAAIEMTVWTFGICAIVYIVLNYCYSTNGCSKTAAMIVHKIMQKKPAFMLDNDFYYNKMKSFSLQYLHWESSFNFNGIGLFVLDYTFIFSVVSAGTSYLIVLLQFDMTPILSVDGLV